MSEWIAKHGMPVFMGLPLVCYTMQALFVYRPQHRYGMALMFMCYAGGIVGAVMDAKGL